MTDSIATKIIELRRAKGLTQEKLGGLLNVSSQAVSKWENGDSLPDIMLLPTLCKTLGISADELLGVPSDIRANNLMDNIFLYAKEVGECRAAYEAMSACSYQADRQNGGAKMASNGVKIQTVNGLGMVFSGQDILEKIKNTNAETIRSMTDLINDTCIMGVIRVMSFGKYESEEEIAEKANLEVNVVQNALFRLLKLGICECHKGDKYTFGAKSYMLFAILGGFYLSSPEGFCEIGNLTCSYNI